MAVGVSATFDLDGSSALALAEELGAVLADAGAQLGASIDEALAAVQGAEVEVGVTVDDEAAVSEIEAVGDSADDVTVAVDADTAPAEAEITGLDADPVVVEVSADTAGAEQEVSGLSGALGDVSAKGGDASGALDAFSGAAIGAGGASSLLTGGLIAAAATGLGAVVSAASEAEVVSAQLDNILQTTGASAYLTSSDVQTLAGEIRDYSGFSDEAVASGATMIATFKNVSSETAVTAGVFDRAVVASADIARLMGTDVTSAAIRMGRALDDPARGLTALRRSGVSFTAEQTAAIEAMVATGDTLGAQLAILEAVEGQLGGTARAYGNTFAGSVDKAKESIGEAAESIGSGLLPALANIADGAASAADGVVKLLAELDELSAESERVNANPFSFAGDLFSGAGPFYPDVDEGEGAVKIFNKAADAASQMAEDTSEATQAMTAFVDAATSNLPTLGDAIGNVDKAGEAFGVLNASTNPDLVIANLETLVDSFVNFSANLSTLPPIVQEALAPLGPAVAGPFAAALAEAPQATQDAMVGVLLEAEQAGLDLTAVLTGSAQGSVAGMEGAFEAGRPGVGAALQGVGRAGVSGLGIGLAGAPGTVRTSVGNAINAARGQTGSASGAGYSIGQALGQGISSGVRDATAGIADAAASAVREAAAAARAEAETGSPSKLFAREVGVPIAEGIAVGIISGTPAVAAASAAAVSGAVVAAGTAAINPRIATGNSGSNVDASTSINMAPGSVQINLPSGVSPSEAAKLGDAAAEGFTDGVRERARVRTQRRYS